MIPYDLAKKLKDARYPIKLDLDLYVEAGDDNRKRLLPNLSELIEACGDSFGALVKVEDGWKAVAVGKTMDNGMLPSQEVSGSTPEEAVANLWLELNKL